MSALSLDLLPPPAAYALALPADRRQAQRHVSVFMLAKISRGRAEALSRVVNLSESGARIETSLALMPGDVVSFEFRSDLRVEAVIRWTHGRAAGMQFTTLIDVDRVIHPRDSRVSRIKPRAPRYRCAAEAQITQSLSPRPCRASDISLQGASFTGHFDCRPHQSVLVEINGLAPRHASVVWVRSDQIGVRFLLPLNFRELDAWLQPDDGAMAVCLH